MNVNTLKESIQAAEDFLKAAKQVKIGQYDSGKKYIETGRASATAKRKSMDLTHALAALRKSSRYS
jgi:hypothetical protein